MLRLVKVNQEREMSSKAAKRRAAFLDREKKRKAEKARQKAISEARDIGSLAKAMGIGLR